jgi:hypothetical protein
LGTDPPQLLPGATPTRGLEPLKEIDAKSNAAIGCDSCGGSSAANALHDLGPDCLRLALTDPALRKIIAAWCSLLPHLRKAILLLVEPGQDDNRSDALSEARVGRCVADVSGA